MNNQRGHIVLYALDMLCMVSSVALIATTLYVLPYVLGYEKYDVPEFVVQFTFWLKTHHSLSGFSIIMATILPPVIAAVALTFISRLITIYIETHEPEPGVPHVDSDEYQAHLASRSANRSGLIKQILTIVALITAVFALLIGVEYVLLNKVL